MSLEGEAREILERLRENCKILAEGYEERVEYRVKVAYHRGECKYHGKSTQPKDDCECPVVDEGRTRLIRRPGLLFQLKEFQQHKDVDRNPKAARGAPRVKTPKCHPELNGFFALDEITGDVYMTVDRALEEAGRDRSWATESVGIVVNNLPGQVAHFVETRPDVARHLARRSARWVETARRALKITVGDAVFEGTVCGNCGGGLATPWDASGDVRCVGTPTDPPCGETYPMSEWINLYERGRS
jgi:hypothetical protein